MSSNQELGLRFSVVFYGLLCTIVISLVLIFLSSLIFHFTPLTEGILPTASLAIVFISVFIGGIISGKKATRQGLIHGLGVGILFIVLSLLLTILFSASEMTIASILLKTSTILLASGLGGVIGIGLSNQ